MYVRRWELVASVFPAKIVNLRIKTQITNFFSNIKKYYDENNVLFDSPVITENKWYNSDFYIYIEKFYSDNAIRTVNYIIKNYPGYSKEPKEVRDLESISFTHHFAIEIPRSYPKDLHKIRILLKTPLYHPRVSPKGSIRNVCYVVRGEIDRVLNELPFFVMMKKDRVEPPNIYKNSDYGLNSKAMKWYIRHMDEIIEFLQSLWISYHKILQNNKKGISRQAKNKIVFL